jgi:deoxyadenosine/deoxycytidine kinase
MYILEGNIGAGKSTFLKLIKERLPHIHTALEPLHNWQSKVYGQSLLANFYDNPKRWAFSMETFAMICRVRDHIKEQSEPNRNRIAERSIYSGHYVFAHNGYEHGFMTELEWNMYNEWFNFLTSKKCKAPLGFIYLYVDPEISLKRLKKRNRIAEKNISFAYLKQIHEHHEKFLIKKDGVANDLKDVPVLLLNCNEEFEENPDIFEQHTQKLQDFLLQTQKGIDTSLATAIKQI